MGFNKLDKAIELISSYRSEMLSDNIGKGTSLINIINFINLSQELGLSLKSALVLCFINENGSASLEHLKRAGIASKNNNSIGSMFRNGKFKVNELVITENSGTRSIGKVYKLTSKGRTLAAELELTYLEAEE